MRLIDADSLITELSKLFPSKMPFDYNEDDNDLGAILCDIKDIIDVQPTVNQWIPCKKRYPEYDTEVVICTDDDTIWLACLVKNERDEYWNSCWSADTAFFDKDEVVAWMPLPEPYNVRGELNDHCL